MPRKLRGEKGDLHQHLGVRPRESWVVAADLITPLLRRLDQGATRALVVPAWGILARLSAFDVEAAIGDARVGGAGLEDIRVGTGEDIGHHGARAGAGGVHAVRIAAEVGHGVLDHVDDSQAVAAALVGQRGGRGDIPAAAGRRCIGVDHDEPVGVGQCGVLGPAEVGVGGAGAVVDCHDNGRRCGHTRRHVHVHAGVSWSIGEGRDLFQGGGEGAGEAGQSGRYGEGRQGEAHVGPFVLLVGWRGADLGMMRWWS